LHTHCPPVDYDAASAGYVSTVSAKNANAPQPPRSAPPADLQLAFAGRL